MYGKALGGANESALGLGRNGVHHEAGRQFRMEECRLLRHPAAGVRDREHLLHGRRVQQERTVRRSRQDRCDRLSRVLCVADGASRGERSVVDAEDLLQHAVLQHADVEVLPRCRLVVRQQVLDRSPIAQSQQMRATRMNADGDERRRINAGPGDASGIHRGVINANLAEILRVEPVGHRIERVGLVAVHEAVRRQDEQAGVV